MLHVLAASGAGGESANTPESDLSDLLWMVHSAR